MKKPTKADKYAAIRRVKAGKSKPSDEIRKLGITAQAWKNSCTRYENETKKGANELARNKVAEPRTVPDMPARSGARMPPMESDTGGDTYSAALFAAGIDTDSPDENHSTDVDDSTSVDSAPESPPMSAADLVAFTETIIVTVPTMIAEMKGLKVDSTDFDIGPRERGTLNLFAPQAVQYAPAITSKFPAGMAIGYLVVVGIALMQRFGAIKKLAALEAAAKKHEPGDFATAEVQARAAEIRDENTAPPGMAHPIKEVLGPDGFPLPR